MKINLEDILACPKCRGRVKLTFSANYTQPEKGTVTCLDCKYPYPVSDGIIDLRTGVTQKGEWDLTAFEKGYEPMGYYKDEYGWAESGGYPRCVTDYRYPRVKGRIIEWLKPENNWLILDVGCGLGYMLFNIMKKYPQVDLACIGLDPVRSNIYWLNHRKKEEDKDNIIGILAEAESLPFRDNVFDAVITTEVMEHIPDKKQALDSMYRVLKAEGRLLITTPARFMVKFWKRFFWLPQQIKRLFVPRQPSLNEKQTYDEPLTKRQLKQYLKEAGFSIEEFQQNALMPHESYFQFFPYILSWLIIKKACLVEWCFKPLFSWTGLHYVVKARK